MGRVITSPGVLKNVQGQIDHVTDMYDDIKDNNLKPLTVTLDPVSNANGAYSHTTEDERITEDMKAVTLEVGTPECFYAPVTVSTANGSATVQCADAHGNSTITVTFVKTSPVTGGADYPPAVTSTEFDILADRIGALTDLDTTDQSNIVNAVNEVIEDIGEVNGKINNIDAGTYTIYLLKGRYNGVWRFWYNWTEKTRSKQVVINSCRIDGVDLPVSNINIQRFTDCVQFYSTDPTFNTTENYVEFNITVTVS